MCEQAIGQLPGRRQCSHCHLVYVRGSILTYELVSPNKHVAEANAIVKISGLLPRSPSLNGSVGPCVYPSDIWRTAKPQSQECKPSSTIVCCVHEGSHGAEPDSRPHWSACIGERLL